jgi:hypothetical protein
VVDVQESGGVPRAGVNRIISGTTYANCVQCIRFSVGFRVPIALSAYVRRQHYSNSLDDSPHLL